MKRIINLSLIVVLCLILTDSASGQIRSVSLDAGFNANQTLVIMPNVYYSETIYSSSPVVSLNTRFGSENLSYEVGLGWSQIRNVFPIDYIPFINDSDSKRPSLHLDEFFANFSLVYPILKKGRFQLLSGIGLSIIYYVTLPRINVAVPPSGEIDIPPTDRENGQKVTFTFTPSRDEYRDFNFGTLFFIEPRFKVRPNLFLQLRVGGRLMILDAFQNRVAYTIKAYPNPGINVTTHMDLKNTGSYFFSTLGLTYMFSENP